MSSSKITVRIFASYQSGKPRMAKWGPIVELKTNPQKTAKDSADRPSEQSSVDLLGLNNRICLDYDPYITKHKPEVLYSLRVGDTSLQIFGQKIELIVEKNGLFHSSSALKISSFVEILPDLPGYLYLRRYDDITRVDVYESFREKEIRTVILKEINSAAAVREGLVALISQNFDQLRVLDYDPIEGRKNSTKKYSLKTFTGKQNCSQMMLGFAGSGVLLLAYEKGVYYLRFIELYGSQSSVVRGDLQIDLALPYNIKVPTFNLKRSKSAVLFEKRKIPLAMILHPINMLQYALAGFKGGRLLLLLDFEKSSSLLFRLQGAFEMLIRKIEYDHKSNKIWMIMNRVDPSVPKASRPISTLISKIRYNL